MRALGFFRRIQAQPEGTGPTLDARGANLSPSHDGCGRTLNLFLAEAGCYPDGPHPSRGGLEEVFLRLTGNGERGAH
jgi:hypothetical protein